MIKYHKVLRVICPDPAYIRIDPGHRIAVLEVDFLFGSV